MLQLPILYKKTSTGASQFWKIEVRGAEVITTFGQVGGKEQTTSDTIREGKNLGRSNETTVEQQAEAEAKARHKKKRAGGYVESIDDAKSGKVDACIEGGILPMLAHKYSEQSKKIIYPALAQRKYDGIRVIALLKDGVCTLWSRTRKPVLGIPHIARAIEKAFPYQDLSLDGEAFNLEYKDNFEQIVHFVRQEEPAPGHEIVQFHIYDTPSLADTQALRSKWLELHIPQGHPILKCVETIEVKDEAEMLVYFEQFLVEGMEGLILRNKNSLYENKRSYSLQKVKSMDDAEFPIIGVGEGRGKLQGHAAVFVCKMLDGQQFEAKMRGSQAMLKKYWEDKTLWAGKWLTVRYQGLTNKNGVPRFPVGVRIREPE